MTNIRNVTGLVSFCCAMLASSTGWCFGGKTSSSCTFNLPDKVTSGDEWYGTANWDWCRQDWLNNIASIYGMKKADWDKGFGFDDACNTDLPFARFATARVALEVSTANGQTSGDIDLNRPFLDWGLLWSFRIVDDLRGSCGTGDDAVAAYEPNGLSSSYIHLNVLAGDSSDKGYFYGFDVPGRAAVLIHEARHWDGGPDHVNDDGQDQRFNNGGSFTWEVIWLWWYAAAAVNAPPALRCSARDLANSDLGEFFVDDPGFVIEVDGLGC